MSYSSAVKGAPTTLKFSRCIYAYTHVHIYIYMPGKNEFQRYRGYDTDCCSVYRNTVPLKTRFCKIMFSHKIEHACINHSRTRVSIMHASKRAGPRRRTLSVTPPRPCAPAPPRPRAPNLNVERDLRVEAHDSKAARPTEPSTLRLGVRGYSRDSWGWEYGVPEF